MWGGDGEGSAPFASQKQRKRTAPSTHTVVQEAPVSNISAAAQERQKKKLVATVTETPMVLDKPDK